MQDRYVGDIGDFVKLALLRALMPGRQLGVGWYLTPDESHNGIGRHTTYLYAPDKWRSLDPVLFDHLHSVFSAGKRSIQALQDGPLGSARFFSERLTSPRDRAPWFSALQAALMGCDLVFLDPDNGLQPSGFRAGSGRSIKSIIWAEIAALRQPGRTLIIYHHQTRMRGGHDVEIEHLAGRLLALGAARVVAVRSKAYSPRVFFIVDPDDALAVRASNFAKIWAGVVSLRSFEPGDGAAVTPELSAAVSDIAVVLKAARVAADRHRGQRRKDADASPYINHPLALADVLAREGGITDPVVLAAALLHDTIEDTETTAAELVAEFGAEIAGVVAEVTDDKTLSKEERKRLQIVHAAHASDRAKLVKLADKICNLRDIADSPPADWSLQRKHAYFDWAAAVVAGVRDVSRPLAQAFDAALARRSSH